MQFAMVRAAQRHRVFVADLAAQRARLGKRQMMGVRRLLGANQAGLRADEFEVLFVAAADGLGDGGSAIAGGVGGGGGGRRCHYAAIGTHAIVVFDGDLRHRLRRSLINGEMIDLLL